MEKKITFAIAAYNSEKYIASCLDSILRQCGRNVEIIIVDDGSNDETAKICDGYASRHSCIKVIYTDNCGVSAARNLLIRNAKGKWISFVDADDMLSANAMSAVHKYNGSTYDIVYFDTMYFRNDNVETRYKTVGSELYLKSPQIGDLLLSTLYYKEDEKRKYKVRTLYSLWGKMYRLDFLKNNSLFLNEKLTKTEDSEFNFRCLQKAKNILIAPCGFYMYRNHAHSTTARYNPNITEINKIVINAFRDDTKNCTLCSRELIRQRFCMFVIVTMMTDLNQDIFHRDNPKSREDRQNDFKRLVTDGAYRKEIMECKRDMLDPLHRFFYDVIVNCDFNKAEKYFVHKARIEHIKRALNNPYLEKLYKKILRKN